jgi:membrane protease YdiL (CAAX protease family)
MHSGDTQARPNWRAIVTFYVLTCALSWPFFWWRDVHTGSWNAFPLPEEIKDLTWGPAVAALLVFWIMPATRRWAVSFFGPSWRRSAVFFVAPILFGFIGYRIHSGAFSYKLLYYLMIGGVSTLGEEVGWRGFLQGSLRPLGRVRGYLLVALMWEAWHFTSHLKGTLTEVVSRMSIYIPLIVAVTFLLGFVVERTDSLLLAVTLHEWLDIAVDSSGTYLMWAALACIPLWLWLIWTWPEGASVHMPTSTSETREIKQIVVTRE